MSNEKEKMWLSIIYGDFYDIPRAFVVNYREKSYFFDCVFSDAIDGYPDEFIVFELTKRFAFDVEALPWNELRVKGTCVGSVSVEDVVFDASRRRAIREDTFDSLKTG